MICAVNVFIVIFQFCRNDENSCKNNLLVTDKLTSGYQTDEDVQPPISTFINVRLHLLYDSNFLFII